MKLYTASIFILFLLLMQHPATPAKEALSPDERQALADWLSPGIGQAVNDYYNQRQPYMVESISRPYPMILTVAIMTFQHAHNPPYGSDLATFRISAPSSGSFLQQSPSLIRYLHNGDKWQYKLDRFKDELILDVQAAFQLELHHAQKYEYGQLLYAAERRKELLPLVERSQQAIKELLPASSTSGLGIDYKAKFKNTVYPVTYLNERKRQGCMLLKQADGTNVVIKLSQDRSGNWRSSAAERKPGRPMDSSLLWYMQ